MRFDSYHPMINLIYFTAAIACTVCFDHPIFLTISYMCAWVYLIKLKGVGQILTGTGLLILAGCYTAWYSYYHHFGVTTLRVNFIGNHITLESVAYGLERGVTVAAVILWLCCIFELITADKVVYLFGRISPGLSLFLSILLRAVPRIGVRAGQIEISREGIGRGIRQGNLWQRARNLCALISILLTWTMEDFVESASSMKSRGSALKGRTAYSIYRFDNRDRSLVIAFFWCLTAVMMAVLFDQTSIYYDPVIIMNRITPLSVVFYGAYAGFLLLPMGLQMVGEYRFGRLSRTVGESSYEAVRDKETN